MWPASATVATVAEFIIALPGAGENYIGGVKMQKAAKRNLVLTTVSSFNVSGGTGQTIEQEGLYQHITFALIKGTYKKQLDDVGNELIAMADHAIALR